MNVSIEQIAMMYFKVCLERDTLLERIAILEQEVVELKKQSEGGKDANK